MKSRGEIKAKPNKLLVTCVTISEPIKYVQLELKEIKEIKWFLFEDCIIVHVENPNESKKKKESNLSLIPYTQNSFQVDHKYKWKLQNYRNFGKKVKIPSWPGIGHINLRYTTKVQNEKKRKKRKKMIKLLIKIKNKKNPFAL